MPLRWTENPEGLLELISKNGEVIREKRRRPPRQFRGPRRSGRPSKAELVQVCPNPTATRKGLYNLDTLAERISDALIAGVDLKSLGPQHGCPPKSVIARLKRENPDFAHRIQDALEIQAFMRKEELESKVLDIIEAAKVLGGPDSARLAVEAYQWLAEQSDPATYRRPRFGRPMKSLFRDQLAGRGVSLKVVTKP